MTWILAHVAAVQLDVVTGIALITLLFMMLQSEHERCDRVRASWRDVRRLTFAVTSALQRAKQRQEEKHPDAAAYLERAQDLVNELYAAILLVYGQGKLRKEYMVRFGKAIETLALARLAEVFPALDLKAQRKLDKWRLRIL
jgi:hypothetical protein